MEYIVKEILNEILEETLKTSYKKGILDNKSKKVIISIGNKMHKYNKYTHKEIEDTCNKAGITNMLSAWKDAYKCRNIFNGFLELDRRGIAMEIERLEKLKENE